MVEEVLDLVGPTQQPWTEGVHNDKVVQISTCRAMGGTKTLGELQSRNGDYVGQSRGLR